MMRLVVVCGVAVLAGCVTGSTGDTTSSSSSSSSSSSGGGSSSSVVASSSSRASSSSSAVQSSSVQSSSAPVSSSSAAPSSSEIASSSSVASSTSMMPDGTPTLESFDLTPTTINTDAAAATVTMTFRIVDDVEGLGDNPLQNKITFENGTQRLEVSFGSANRVMGTAQDGTYSVDLVVPRYSRNGTFTITAMSFSDAGSRGRTLFTTAFPAMGFPNSFVNEGTMTDTAPPTITSVTIMPAMVNTDAMGQMVTFDVVVTDAGSGVAPAPQQHFIKVQGPTGAHPIELRFTSAARISGDAAEGTYRITLTIPQYAETGTWKIVSLWFYDAAGRVAALTTMDLMTAGLTHTFEQTGTMQDIEAPMLTALSFNPSSVDGSMPNATTTVSYHINDNLSGLNNFFGYNSIVFRSPSGGMHSIGFSGADRSGGTPQNGDYSTIFFIPAGNPGTWVVQSVTIADPTGNSRTYDAAALSTLGVSTTFTVQ